MPMWIENYTVEHSAQLYHKFDKARGSDYARAVAAELDAAKTMEKEVGSIARGGRQVESRTVETGYGSFRYGYSIDDVMKGQSK